MPYSSSARWRWPASFPLPGFFSKDEILWSAYNSSQLGRLLWVLGVAGAFMTAFYSFRLIYLTFYGKSRIDHEVEHHVHESPKVMTIPLMILAFFSIIHRNDRDTRRDHSPCQPVR